MSGGVGDAQKELDAALREQAAAAKENAAALRAQAQRRRMRGMSVSDILAQEQGPAGDAALFEHELSRPVGDKYGKIAAIRRAMDAEAAVRDAAQQDREAKQQDEEAPRGLAKAITEAKNGLNNLPVPIAAAVAAIKVFGSAVAESNANMERGASQLGQGRVTMGQAMRDLGFSPAEQDRIRVAAEHGGFGKNVTMQGMERFFSSAAEASRKDGFQLQIPAARQQLMALLQRVQAGELDIGTATEIAGAGPLPEVNAIMRGLGRTGRGTMSLNAQGLIGEAANITSSAQARNFQQGARMNIQQADAEAGAMDSMLKAFNLWIAQKSGGWELQRRLSFGEKEDPAVDALKNIERKTPGPPPPSTNAGSAGVR
jgi:hypothetical protein